MDLQTCRMQIDRLDQELKKLFLERMQIAKDVAEYKERKQLPIYQPEREEEILKKLCQDVKPSLRPYLEAYFREIFTLSKERQEEVLRR